MSISNQSLGYNWTGVCVCVCVCPPQSPRQKSLWSDVASSQCYLHTARLMEPLWIGSSQALIEGVMFTGELGMGWTVFPKFSLIRIRRELEVALQNSCCKAGRAKCTGDHRGSHTVPIITVLVSCVRGPAASQISHAGQVGDSRSTETNWIRAYYNLGIEC